MNCNEIRTKFLEFFSSKSHTILPSAPMVIKNDPTLMFTNAGMNQFKDIFLGNTPTTTPRVADSQKCLRVSGKHNDLEEVGRDTYHHTMFEMLGNWSFGDYFKREAIDYAWEFLTQVMGLDPNRMYATVFQGDEVDGTDFDQEAFDFWKAHLPEDRILKGNKKDNFWEMGDTGPCGPCSEIHIDLRDEEERVRIAGRDLVNQDNPLVIEIWNLVFMQFNRLASGELVPLASKHVDTGMGFERLCMAVQNKKSNYDTDIFQPIIQKIASNAKVEYGNKSEIDIALRVIADHLRAVSFAIADGQLPSNNGAGYVIRRILRRAIRYGFTFLNFKEPFIYQLVSDLETQMGHQYPELKSQKNLIEKVIQEEENSFLKTLDSGILKFENYCKKMQGNNIDGAFAFELFDTYGFPIDLTQLLASEKGLSVDMEGFQKGLEEQKQRSRAAAAVETEDWIELNTINTSKFVGYDMLTCETHIQKYRCVKTKGKKFFQIVLDQTPFYAESGGQAGDIGVLESVNEKINIINTIKENNLTIHLAQSLPENLTATFVARVNEDVRCATQNNHSATHLIHNALRTVLGVHVEQKGSSVTPDRLRFDFSHFSKVTDEELRQVEHLVNQKIRANTPLEEFREVAIEDAKNMGAMALFGEKYGDKVRVVKFGNSIELCGGTHTSSTGNIGMFKIVSEGAIAAGVRRIEAVTGQAAETYIFEFQDAYNTAKQILNAPNVVTAIQKLIADNDKFKKEIEDFNKERANNFVKSILNQIEERNGINIIAANENLSPDLLKQAAYDIRNKKEQLLVVLGTTYGEKPNIVVALSDDMVQKGLNAGQMVREGAKLMQGGGGGQPSLATAGGKNCAALNDAIQKVIELAIQQ